MKRFLSFLIAVLMLFTLAGCDNLFDRDAYEQWLEQITDNDVVVIAGDVSWGMSLRQALADFQFLDMLCHNLDPFRNIAKCLALICLTSYK